MLLMTFPSLAAVKGKLEAVKIQGDKVVFSGWACQAKLERSIEVSVFVGGEKGKGGQLIKSQLASDESKSLIGNVCQTSKSNHRFSVKISKKSLYKRRQQDIYLYGIDIKGNSVKLSQSGKFQIPGFRVALSWLKPTQSNDIIIPSGLTVFLDQDVQASVLRIQGTLVCPQEGRRRVSVKGILVSGKLQCGTLSAPVKGRIIFKLRKGAQLGMMGERAFGVMAGGVVEMFGDTQRNQWTRLSKTVHPGEREIQLMQSVGWRPGDKIAFAPSEFSHLEAEERTISKKIDSKRYVLDSPLKFSHFGTNKNYSRGGNSWTLKSSAEVANLTRNIVITTGDLSHSGTDQHMGAHMMVMRGGEAYIDGVEFAYMGQAGVMGRYPFHWHLAGDVSGQFIKNSSIHHSFQRCITIHGTDGALVENNSCFDHRGHGIFLEDGNERFNTITNNLVILSKIPFLGKELLASDHLFGQVRRFRPPSAFWISHPQNKIVGNVSAGSQGTGFWMSFEEKSVCDKLDGAPCMVPARGRTLQFDKNIAKTNKVGFTWDGARSGRSAQNPNNSEDQFISSSTYLPPIIPTFVGNQAMLSSEACFYTRSSTMNFEKTVSAECAWHHFHAFNIRINNSILVGDGPFLRTDLTRQRMANGVRAGRYGIVLYDGPFELDNVFFKNFSTKEDYHKDASGFKQRISSVPIGKIGGSNKYTNRVNRLHFSPEPLMRVDLFESAILSGDWHVSQGIIDMDGSLSGIPNSFVTVKNGFNLIPGCQLKHSWNAIFCDADQYQIGNLVIHDFSDYAKRRGLQNSFYFNTIRNGTKQVRPQYFDGPVTPNHSKVNLLVDSSQYYEVDLEGQSMSSKVIKYHTEREGESSNIIRFINMKESFCMLVGATSVSSVAELRAATKSVYMMNGQELWVRLRPNIVDEKFSGSIRPRSISHYVSCSG